MLLQRTHSEESVIPGVLLFCVVWMVVEGREEGGSSSVGGSVK